MSAFLDTSQVYAWSDQLRAPRQASAFQLAGDDYAFLFESGIISVLNQCALNYYLSRTGADARNLLQTDGEIKVTRPPDYFAGTRDVIVLVKRSGTVASRSRWG